MTFSRGPLLVLAAGLPCIPLRHFVKIVTEEINSDSRLNAENADLAAESFERQSCHFGRYNPLIEPRKRICREIVECVASTSVPFLKKLRCFLEGCDVKDRDPSNPYF